MPYRTPVRPAYRQDTVVSIPAHSGETTASCHGVYRLPYQRCGEGVLHGRELLTRGQSRDRPLEGLQPLYGSQQVELHRHVPRQIAERYGTYHRYRQSHRGRCRIQVVRGITERRRIPLLFHDGRGILFYGTTKRTTI